MNATTKPKIRRSRALAYWRIASYSFTCFSENFGDHAGTPDMLWMALLRERAFLPGIPRRVIPIWLVRFQSHHLPLHRGQMASRLLFADQTFNKDSVGYGP